MYVFCWYSFRALSSGRIVTNYIYIGNELFFIEKNPSVKSRISHFKLTALIFILGANCIVLHIILN